MKMLILRIHLSKSFMSVTRLLLIFLLTTQVSTACSWDYLIWQIRSKSADPLYRFVQNGKAGYIDRSGKVIIEPKYEAYGNGGYEFENGLLHLSVSEAQYIDTTGKLVIDKNHSSAWDFSEGLAAAMPENGRKWGYIDRSGEFVISPRFNTYPKGYVYSFSEGLAMIEVANEYGYIDRTGEFIIQPKFLYGTDFHEGLARVVVEGPCGYSGEGPCPDVRMLGERVRGKVPACKFTFIDKSGSIITSERYDYAKDFSEGLAPVRVGDKWGYIDKKGRMVIEPKFDRAEEFSDGLARVQQGKLYGYIDYNGALVIPPQFKYADDFSDGLAVVSNAWNEKEFIYEEFHYINKKGEQAISEKFALASHFFKGLAHVKLKSNRNKNDNYDREEKGTFAYIDVSGRKVFTYEGEK
jgi:hypothetical protein